MCYLYVIEPFIKWITVSSGSICDSLSYCPTNIHSPSALWMEYISLLHKCWVWPWPLFWPRNARGPDVSRGHSWIRDLAWIYCCWGSPGVSAGKESACNVGDLDSIPGLGRCPREGKGYALQYSGLENSMDRGAWQATVYGVTESQTWLGDLFFF